MPSNSNIKFIIIYFFININIFPHSELKIVLAIPASNEWKIEMNNSIRQHKG